MLVARYRAYFKKARHGCGMTKQWHILINLRQFEDDSPFPPKQHANFEFLESESTKEIPKRSLPADIARSKC